MTDLYPLIERLNCRYNGRDFSGPAPEGMVLPTSLMKEAAAAIETLQQELALSREREQLLKDSLSLYAAESAWSSGDESSQNLLFKSPDGSTDGFSLASKALKQAKSLAIPSAPPLS